MKKPKQPSKILFLSGGIFTIFGSIAQIFDFKSSPWIFSVGSAVLIYIHFINFWGKKNAEIRQQRLARIGFTTSLLLILGAYLMFTESNLWVLAVLIYALSSLYVSFKSE